MNNGPVAEATGPPKLPTFQGPPETPDLTTYREKAQALAERFFPDPLANLRDIEDLGLAIDWEESF